VKCKTVTENCSSSNSLIERVDFELDVARLLEKCQCAKLLFSALQTDRKLDDFTLLVNINLELNVEILPLKALKILFLDL